MTIEEIKQQLDFLSEKIDLINANLQFNITTFLAVLALAIAIVGVALVLLVKNIVNKRVEEQLDKKIEEIKKSIIEGLKKEEFICELPMFDSWKLIQKENKKQSKTFLEVFFLYLNLVKGVVKLQY